MRAQCTLKIACKDDGVRRSLAAVLTPDNEGAPRGLRLSMEGRGKEVSLTLGTDAPETALSTTVALLKDVTLFQEVWLLSSRGRRGGLQDA